jgi:hypothetical protein
VKQKLNHKPPINVPLKSVVNGLSQQEIDNHIEMGKKLLAAGQLADALTHYHSAIGLRLFYSPLKINFSI